MKTDDLIEALARDAAPPPRRRFAARFAVTAGLGLTAAFVLLMIAFGLRSDFAAAAPAVFAKAAFSALLASLAAPLVMQLAKPGRPIGWRLAAIGLALAASVAIGAVSLLGVDPAERWRLWTGGGFPWCLVIIPLLAAPIAAALVWLLRDLAPTRIGLAGAAVGGFSGGLAALVYAMYCPVDSVAFVATWYACAIAICAALGAIVGARFLRWS